jgi:hypothetical protein
MSDNPIIEAWEEHPEMRPDFIEFLAGRYNSLFKRLEDERINLTDPE